MSNVKTYSKSANGSTYLSTNFQVKEFACKDGTDKILIDLDGVAFLQKIRDWAGAPITINSAYRTASHNASVGGSSNSYHVKGQAFDIVVSGKTVKEVAAYAETLGMNGIMRYDTSNFVHIDTRTTKYYATVANSITTSVSTFGGSSSSSSTGTSNSNSAEVELRKEGIKNTQTWLNSTYGVGLSVDGVDGPNTRTALIKAAQTEIGVTVDGIWGTNSKSACPVLIVGSSGNIVYILQGLLYCNGYVYSGFDGKFGSMTESEVKSYQGASGLTIDGKAGKDTFTSLIA